MTTARQEDFWLLEEGVGPRDLEPWAARRGGRLVFQMPWCSGVREDRWEDPAERWRVHCVSSASTGRAVLLCQGEEAEAVRRDLAEHFGMQRLEDAMAAFAQAQDPHEAVRRAAAVAAFRPFVSRAEEVVPFLVERMLDERPLVRHWAFQVLRHDLDRRDVLEGILAAAERHEEFAGLVGAVREQLQAIEAGVAEDGPTDDVEELLERMREAAAQQNWRRVEHNMAMLFDEELDVPEGLLLAARCFEAQSDPVQALAAAGAALGSTTSRIEALGETEDPEEAREELEALRRMQEEAREAVARLRSQLEAMDRPRREEALEPAVAWIQRFLEEGEGFCAGSAAETLLGFFPEWEAAFHWAARVGGDEFSHARRAAELAPDAPAAHVALGWAHAAKGAFDEAEAALRRAVELADRGEEAGRSEAAERLQRLADSEEAPTRGVASLAEMLVVRAYEAEDWERAARLAEIAVRCEHASPQMWQARANAYTFAGDYERAIACYREALNHMEEARRDPSVIMIGEDPRGPLRFNFSCVLARLGRHEEAIEMLKAAVRLDDGYRAMAAADDFFDGMRDHPELQAIVNGAPVGEEPDEDDEEGFPRVEVSGPAADAERAFWDALGARAEVLVRQGMEPADVARLFLSAITGSDLPPDLPEDVAALARGLAERMHRWPGFLVTATVALDLAASTNAFDDVFDNLREIALSHLAEELDGAG